ncbi:hypothetical protein [Paraburkholderia humisilvae]|uniref:Uncharacterized protein n=1 Tax=Paraburkholderia humisilvae TaxID=627669 RepID=A0A6J5DLV9_9BURK|nr:hypothetical protein [Paraburkholderia humisilvae]CAB3754221.1 hypothetical protein LMG29542_02282 [Paraburkholderia humisilvae]
MPINMTSLRCVLAISALSVSIAAHAQQAPDAGLHDGEPGTGFHHHHHHHCGGPTPGGGAAGGSLHRCGNHQWHGRGDGQQESQQRTAGGTI